jgi:hypothetical protein
MGEGENLKIATFLRRDVWRGPHHVDQMWFKLNYVHEFKTRNYIDTTDCVVVSCLVEDNGHTETRIFKSDNGYGVYGPPDGMRPGS